jgi:serine/threonine-protein kinase RsbT
LKTVESVVAAGETSSPVPEKTMAIVSDEDIIAARQQGRAYVLQLGFSSPEATLVATAISELARNIVMYAKEGEIVITPLQDNGRPGVMVVARDDGPGISEIRQAAIAASSSGGGMVPGLRGLKRLVDELQIDSRAGEGTRVAIKKWKA